MWDLVKGRCTYTVRLEAEAEAVSFCAEDGGARYALLCGTLITLHSVGEAGALRALAHPRRALCMAWAPGGRIVSGCEDGSLRLWDTQVWGGAILSCLPFLSCCLLVLSFCLPAHYVVGAGARRCTAAAATAARCACRACTLHAAAARRAPRAPMKETPFTHSTLGLTVQC